MCRHVAAVLGLRDYGIAGQIGLEPTLAEFIQSLTGVFAEVKRVLAPDGILWLNLGTVTPAAIVAGGRRTKKIPTGP